MTFAGPRKVTAPHDDEVDRWKVDITEETTALKQQPGGDLVAHGGPTFVHELSRRGIIDLYRLVVQPGAIGLGSPLFKDLADTIDLELLDARPFPSSRSVSSTSRVPRHAAEGGVGVANACQRLSTHGAHRSSYCLSQPPGAGSA